MDEKEQVRARLRGILYKVPPAHSIETIDRARGFKAAVDTARRALNARNSTLLSLQQAERGLELWLSGSSL